MAYLIYNTGPKWQPCLCCGRKMRLIDGHRDLSLFMIEKSAQRRGYRCMNCGQATCFKCGHNGKRCACQGNAWVALPYLEGAIDFHAGT
ncbi:MAG: hypothetical protein PVI54_12715 [Desulfobacteraceae bacterium]